MLTERYMPNMRLILKLCKVALICLKSIQKPPTKIPLNIFRYFCGVISQGKFIGIMIAGVFALCVLASCSSTKHTTATRKHPKQNTVQVHKPVHTSRSHKKLLEEAETWMGTPYLYGGKEKGVGADCSGFVMMVYLNALDVKLPRRSAKQAEFCTSIEEEEAEPGDLVFFATGREKGKVTHVGMMIDREGTFIHASSSKGVVHSSMNNQWYRRHLVGFGRVPR